LFLINTYTYIWPIEMRNEHQNLNKEQINY
jgi:hypothetical protein